MRLPPAFRGILLGLALALAALASMSTAAASAYSGPTIEPAENWPQSIEGGTAYFELPYTGMKCTTVKGRFYLEGFNEWGSLDLTFQGCREMLLDQTCSSEGAAAGEVRFEGMEGRLVYLSREHHEAGFRMSPEDSRFTCTRGAHETHFVISGEVLAKFTPVDEQTTDFSLALKSPGGKQEFTTYELEGETIEGAQLYSQMSENSTHREGHAELTVEGSIEFDGGAGAAILYA